MFITNINDRSFTSKGIQSDLRWDTEWLGLSHDVKTGLRYHEDQINRFHTEDAFNMLSGQLVNAGAATELVTANTERSRVWSKNDQWP